MSRNKRATHEYTSFFIHEPKKTRYTWKYLVLKFMSRKKRATHDNRATHDIPRSLIHESK